MLYEVITLSSANLTAWWPFLCCSVAVYGLLPRCLLLLIGWLKQRKTLEKLHFATLNFRSLLQRMTAPRGDTNGVTETKSGPGPQPYTPKTAPIRTPVVHEPESSPLTGNSVSARQEPISKAQPLALALVLIPEELYPEFV